jgi:hypothetical protein
MPKPQNESMKSAKAAQNATSLAAGIEQKIKVDLKTMAYVT